MHFDLVDFKCTMQLIPLNSLKKIVCNVHQKIVLAVRMACLCHFSILLTTTIIRYHKVIFFLTLLWPLSQEKLWNLNAQHAHSSMFKFLHLPPPSFSLHTNFHYIEE